MIDAVFKAISAAVKELKNSEYQLCSDSRDTINLLDQRDVVMGRKPTEKKLKDQDRLFHLEKLKKKDFAGAIDDI